MRNRTLAADHVRRADARLKALDALYEAESWADVVRESQEVVELALKGLLRTVGIDPPRVHDVADVLEAERSRLPAELAGDIDRLGRHIPRPAARPRASILGRRGPCSVRLLQGAGCRRCPRQRPLRSRARPATP